MRFFSNEAKENADDQPVDENDLDRADSAGAPVPQQRTGSPWSDAPGEASDTSDADVVDGEGRNGTEDALRSDDSEVRHDGDDLVRDADGTRGEDDLDLPLDGQLTDEDRAGSHRSEGEFGTDAEGSAIGSSAIGSSPVEERADFTEGGVDATDHRIDTTDDEADGTDDRVDTTGDGVDATHDRIDTTEDDVDATDHRVDTTDDGVDATDGRVDDTTEDDVDPTDERVHTTDGLLDQEPGAEQRSGTTTTYGPDGSVTTVDSSDEPTDTVADEPVAADPAETTDDERDLDEVAPVLTTAPAHSTFADSSAADSTFADSSAAGSTFADSSAAGSADADSTAAADSVTDSAPAADSITDSADEGFTTDADAAPAVAAVPVGAADVASTGTAARPDPSASPVGDKLFTDGDSFNDRLRDISLNFVDNPKEATEQAGSLVDEAIDRVTSALKAQKDTLAGEGDDTEKLRVELRGYREILKRLTAL